MDLYVSPRGNDAWSGRRPAPNRAQTDGPLATPAGAQYSKADSPAFKLGFEPIDLTHVGPRPAAQRE